MRRSTRRFHPAMLAALLASVLILVGFLAFLLISARSPGVDVTVTVQATPSPTLMAAASPVALSASPPPTLVGLSAPTSAPLVTLVVTETPVPTATATAVPTQAGRAPPPVQSAPPAPTPAAAAAGAGPVATQPAPAAPQPPPAPPGTPTVGGQASSVQPAPTPPPAAAPVAAGTQGTVGEPSPPGGFGNTQGDFQATYGAPVGRTPDGLEVYLSERAEVQAAFRNGRAQRLRLVLRDDRVIALDEARELLRRFIPRDSQPGRSSGQDTSRPVDEFRSAALASLFDASAFNGAEPGTFSAAYQASRDLFSGFDIQLGRLSP